VGVRRKLFLVSLGLIIASVIAAHLLVTNRIVPVVVAGIQEDLEIRLGCVRQLVERAPLPLDDLASWDALADTLGRASSARVSIIRLDGVVIGDSEVEARRLPDLEPHGSRPEILRALQGGRGADRRDSQTTHEQMLYVALPFSSGGARAGTIRAAVPLTAVDETVAQFRAVLALGSLLAVGVAIVLSSLAVTWVTAPLRALTASARRLARGDLTLRIGGSSRDEIGQLAAALDELADNLKQTLDRLRADLALQEHILHDLREGVILLDADGRIAMVNPALREMWLLAGDPVGRLPLEVTRQAEIHGLFQRTRQTGLDQSTEIETGGLRPRRLLAHAAPLSGDTGGVLGVFVDVTDLRRLETVRRDFVANVSHELRTPVATIRSAAETIRHAARSDPEAADGFLSMIERSAERMGRLVDDLLELSRIEAGEYRLRPQPIELAEAAELVLAAYRREAEEKGIRLRQEIPASFPPLFSDRVALEQILGNLVGNAVRYCDRGAVVTVRAAEGQGTVRVEVHDTGPGIEPHHLPRLFERFYRVDPGRSRELGGTGLGLSIVRRLVEAMGGRVGVESRLGLGSVFHFHLPIHEPAAARREERE